MRRTGWSPEEAEELVETVEPEAVTEESGRSTVEMLKLLLSDGRAYAATEMERQKLRARILGMAARDAAILGIVALCLLMGAVIALPIGAIWVLAPYMGPVAAILIILGTCFALAVLLALIARARVRQAMRRALGREKP